MRYLGQELTTETMEKQIKSVQEELVTDIHNEGSLQLEVLNVPVVPATVDATALQTMDLLSKNPEIIDQLLAVAIPDELIETAPEVITLKGFGGISFSGLGKWKSPAKRRSESHKHKINSMMATGATPEQLAQANKKYKDDKKKAKKAIVKAIVIAAALVVAAVVIIPAITGGAAAGGGAAAAGGGAITTTGVLSSGGLVSTIVSKAVETGGNPANIAQNLLPKEVTSTVASLTGKTPAELASGLINTAKKQTNDVVNRLDASQATETPFILPKELAEKKSYTPIILGGAGLVLLGILVIARKK